MRGLENGPDDYVQKPFHYEELRARIQTVLRRRHSRHDGPVRIGEILTDPPRPTVKVVERVVQPSKKEFTLIRVLASVPTGVFSKDEPLRGLGASRRPPKNQDARLPRQPATEQTRPRVQELGVVGD